MKKYYILMVVLSLIIISEGVIIFLNVNQDGQLEESYINIPKEEENVDINDDTDSDLDIEDNGNDSNSGENVDLNDDVDSNGNNEEDNEMNEYLNYIPYYLPLDFAAYFADVTVDEVDQDVLIASALTLAMYNYYDDKCSVEECGYYLDNPMEIQYLYDNMEEPVYGLYYLSFDYINNMLDNMYNIQLNNLEETTSWDNVYVGASGSFAFQNGYFLMCASGIGLSMYHVGFIDNWTVENDELIIYEVGAYRDTYLSVLKDYRNDYEITINAHSPDETLEALRENREHYTIYKHIFRSSDNGYYWYSTEAI